MTTLARLTRQPCCHSRTAPTIDTHGLRERHHPQRRHGLPRFERIHEEHRPGETLTPLPTANEKPPLDVGGIDLIEPRLLERLQMFDHPEARAHRVGIDEVAARLQ